jgi:hypothetical protein
MKQESPWLQRASLTAMICLAALISSRIQAATLVVTNLADSGSGTLRTTLALANSDDLITFAVAGTITNRTGELRITKRLSIVGPGPATLAISGNSASRIFNLLFGEKVSISGLTICNGHAADGAAGTNNVTPGLPGTDGGGIYNSGTLTLSNCIITRCRSGQGGAGYDFRQFYGPVGCSDGGPGGNGGGIYNAGTLTLVSCTLSYNTNGSGGRGGNAVIQNYPGASGASGGSGGAIYDAGVASAVGCTFAFNSAGTGGAGGAGGDGLPFQGETDAGAGGLGSVGGNGGGMCSQGSSAFTSCTFFGNTGGAGGQGGAGGYGNSPRGGIVSDVGNGAPGGNGGMGGNGGACHCSGVFQAVACTFNANASGVGGPGGRGGGGGSGVLARLPGGNGASGGNGGSGGGGGGVSTGGSSTLQNVLAAQDIAAAGAVGGWPGAGGGGYPNGSSGSPGIDGTTGIGRDLLGAFVSNGHNLIGLSDGNTGFTDGLLGDIVGLGTPINACLGPLTNNGGPTLTCRLLAGSPALETGDDTLLSAQLSLTNDQRGFSRQSGSHVDIGAFELQWASSPICVAACAWTTNRAVLMTITNIRGASLTALAATNLSVPLPAWTVIGSIPEIAPGQFQFIDLAPTNLPRRFYRFRCP